MTTEDSSVRIETLPNGLTILGEPTSAHQSAAVGFFVRTGARDETAAEAGVSHFLEHMMFKGTATRSSLDITFQMGNIGAQANAFTSEESTVYYSAIIPEHFSQIQEIVSDMLRPSLDPKEFDTEKNVILEEIALYKDRPQYYLYERAVADYFAGHSAGNSVLGSHESISALSRDQMAAYFTRRYSPSNMVLVATGRFDWKTFRQAAEKLCGGWSDHPAPREHRPHTQILKRTDFHKSNLNQCHLLYLGPGCSAQDQERFALTVLTSILGDSSGSRMYWALVDTGIAECASADLEDRDAVGCVSAYAASAPEKIDQVAQRMEEILATPLEFSDADLERAKAKITTKIMLNGELPMGRLMSLGLEWNLRRTPHSLRREIASFREVNRKAIEAALEKFPIGKLSLYRLLPGG